MAIASILPIWISLAMSAQPVDSTSITRTQPQLQTPEVIARAVLPYLSCLYASRGLPLLRGSDGSQIEYDNRSGDCSAARTRAEAEALKLLAGKPVPGGASPAAFVEEALSKMDDYVSSLPVLHRSDISARQSIVGVPITIEDEVKPAYDRYEECLKTQASETPFTADTILITFRQAITICGSVRDSAVAEAENALIKKGWDARTRASAAENTFKDADKSWLVMGMQFREAILVRLAQQAKVRPDKAPLKKR